MSNRDWLQARTLAAQVGALTYSLTAGAFHSNPPSLIGEPQGLARLGIAAGAGTLALLMRSRPARRSEFSPATLLIDLIFVYGSVLLSQVLLGWFEPSLALPNWAPTQGGYVGCMLFMAARAMTVFQTDGGDLPLAIGEIRNRCKRYRMRYGIASAVTSALGLAGLTAASIQVRIASSFVVVGSAYLIFKIIRAATPFVQGEAILRAALVWYYGALFPASLVALFGSKVYLYWIPLVILLFAELNARAAKALANYISIDPKLEVAAITQYN